MSSLEQLYKYKYLVPEKLVEVKVRKQDGTFTGQSWIDIKGIDTESNAGSVKFSIDSNDFDIGDVKVSNLSLSINNIYRKFSKETDQLSIFRGGFRHNSFIRLTVGYSKLLDPADFLIWDVGNWDEKKWGTAPGEEKDKATKVLFLGLLDGRGFSEDEQLVSGQALSLMNIFTKLASVDIGVLTPANVNLLVEQLVNTTAFLEYITVNPSDIVPANNIYIDSPNVFTGSIFDFLKTLALISNSVFYVDSDGRFIFRGRSPNPGVKFNFKKDDVVIIKDITDGSKRIITRFKITDENIYSDSGNSIIRKYGIIQKEVDAAIVANPIVKLSITDALIREFGAVEKREFTLVVKFCPFVEILDIITIDFPPNFSNEQDLLIWDIGEWDTDKKWGKGKGGAIVDSFKQHKIISISHDLKGLKTELKVREV